MPRTRTGTPRGRWCVRCWRTSGCANVPVWSSSTRIDLLPGDELLALRKRAAASGARTALFTSALTPSTLEPLKAELHDRIRARMRRVRVELSAGEGKALAALYEEGEVLSSSQEGHTVTVVANASPALIGRLRARNGVCVTDCG